MGWWAGVKVVLRIAYSNQKICHKNPSDESCKFPMDISYEVSDEEPSTSRHSNNRHFRPPNFRSSSLTRPRLDVPSPLTRSHSVSRSALAEAHSRLPNRRPPSATSARLPARRHIVPPPEDEFDYISTRITRRNPLLAKVSTSANSSLKRTKHPLLGKISQARSTSGGRNWMQLKSIFVPKFGGSNLDEENVELVRHL